MNLLFSGPGVGATTCRSNWPGIEIKNWPAPDKGGAFKGPAKGQCLDCMVEQEYDLTEPANGREVLKRVEKLVEIEEESWEGGLPENPLDEPVEMQSRFLQFMEFFANQVVVNLLAYRFLYGTRY